LWLDGNKLSEIPDFSHLSKLEHLRLSANNFKLLQSFKFSKTNHFIHLYLNDLEYLVAIEQNAFTDLPRLRDLDISGSPRMKFIHPRAFNNVPSLTLLNLAGNGLFSINSNIAQSLPALKLLSLQHVSLIIMRYSEYNQKQTRNKCVSKSDYKNEFSE